MQPVLHMNEAVVLCLPLPCLASFIHLLPAPAFLLRVLLLLLFTVVVVVVVVVVVFAQIMCFGSDLFTIKALPTVNAIRVQVRGPACTHPLTRSSSCPFTRVPTCLFSTFLGVVICHCPPLSDWQVVHENPLVLQEVLTGIVKQCLEVSAPPCPQS